MFCEKRQAQKIIFGAKELKYFGDICTMNGATVKMVVLKSFEEKGLIGLCA